MCGWKAPYRLLDFIRPTDRETRKRESENLDPYGPSNKQIFSVKQSIRPRTQAVCELSIEN